MSYCINPNCPNRQNPDDLECCQSCGTKLLINERYQIVRPLRAGQAYNSEVFEVRDLNERGSLKVLKCLAVKHNNSRFSELFEKEAQALIWLSSFWQKHPGIPNVKPDGYFTFGLNNGFRKLQCLVMEKIEGQNLEEWIEQNQPISQDQALNWLQQLVKILDKVHQQGLWHRDIKPSNIMLKPDGQLVLIDFGAVGIGETRIVSINYTPQEQIEGRTVPQSDFFALGRTFVYLLTGKHPSEFSHSVTGQLLWRDAACHILPKFAKLIDDLMAHWPANRPQNTQEIWKHIQEISNSDCTEKIGQSQPTSSNFRTPQITENYTDDTNQPRRFSVKVLCIAGVTLLLGLGLGIIIISKLSSVEQKSHKTALSASGGVEAFGDKKYGKTINDNLSFGEEILTGTASSEKQLAVKAFRAKKYAQAVDLLNEARKNEKSDPETLIYLNNARLEAQNVKSYTIAVAAPLNTSSEGMNSALEILRGVAQAQDEFNQEQKEVGIKVLIADDANKSEQAQQIAKALVNQEEVLAVVGHFTSDSTLATAKIYQQNKLVFVSPTSTAEDLSTQKQSPDPNFFFRTVPSDRITAQTLTDYLSKQANQQTAAVFYNPYSTYSSSLRNQFRDSLNKKGGKVVYELDLSTPIINLGKAIDQAGKRGAKVLALFPNSKSSILNNTRKLINTNRCRYSLVGGDTVDTPDILDEVGKEATNCLAIAVPWHNIQNDGRTFPQSAEKLWGEAATWRTALAYDATRALIAALEKTPQPSRISLQQTLSNPDFKAEGATGEIRFESNGDRKNPQIELVQVQPNK